MAAPGDTIKFVAVDQFHNAETILEIWPEGAAPFQGELSKDVTLTVEKEGVYGIKCLPHFLMGMMALVLVGKPVNISQVTSFKPPAPAAKRFEALAARNFRNSRGEVSWPIARARARRPHPWRL
ncbi:MAG: plastocyanin/azurin family copper-binding protein [Methyloceanibacter sp.]